MAGVVLALEAPAHQARLLLAAPAALAVEPCDPAGFKAEVLSLLRQEFPERHFDPGSEDESVLLGKVELGLSNLRGKVCGEGPPLAGSERAEAVRRHFRTILELVDRKPEPDTDLAAAKARLRLQLVPESHAREKGWYVSRPFVPGVIVAVVLDQGRGYQNVREEDRKRWGLSAAELFDLAREAFDEATRGSRMEGGDGTGRRFLAVEVGDGYDAAKLLLPWVRQEAAKLLGNPFRPRSPTATSW